MQKSLEASTNLRTLCPDLAREFFDYDKTTGILTHRIRDQKHFKTERAFKTWNTRYSNTQAGYVNKAGYLRVGVFDVNYWVHRIIWLWVHGEMPKHIDHINGIPSDNRVENLRSVTHKENHKNQVIPRSNTSGVMGVSWHKLTKKWQSNISINGKNTYLGLFSDKNEAIKARKQAEIEQGYHENHGREIQC